MVREPQYIVFLDMLVEMGVQHVGHPKMTGLAPKCRGPVRGRGLVQFTIPPGVLQTHTPLQNPKRNS